MPEGQDKVLEAFEALQKALEEEQERLSDPTVAELLRRLGNERLGLVEWMLSEVQKLAAIWREGKVPTSGKTCTKRHKRRAIPQELAEKFIREFGDLLAVREKTSKR
jgi:hypothetical protein